MDNLVLLRVAACLDRDLAGRPLQEIREQGPTRFRLSFETEGKPGGVIVSLRPELPWIGRPSIRGEGRTKAPSPFAAACMRAIGGGIVTSVAKDPVDRVLVLSFADGHRLVAEMAVHSANLILLDREGNTLISARSPKSGRERLRAGTAYAGRGLPRGKIPVVGADPGAVDRWIEEARNADEDPANALARHVFGLGAVGAALVLEESRARNLSPGHVLSARIAGLVNGELDPVIEGPGDPSLAAQLPDFDPSAYRLLPWEPHPRSAPSYWTREDAAGTAGLFYDSLEESARIASRLEALLGILRGEVSRTLASERKADADLRTHEDPHRHRKWAEALLAGMSRARRSPHRAFVPDPYDAEGGWIEVPAPSHLTLAAAADQHFRRHRRAVRGLEAASARSASMRARRGRLDDLFARFEGRGGSEAEEALAAAMREEGIPVSLEPATRAGRSTALATVPRLEGVRLLTSSDGLEILVGRSGKENDRLTFRLASPEDFWFHAQGFPGAHVVVRNPTRFPRPPQKTIEEAASLAAWYSDARRQGVVDVHWTRRKYVHRVRGAPPGTVTLKRFETVRVVPRADASPLSAP